MPNFFDLPIFLQWILFIPYFIFVGIPAISYEVLKYLF